MDKLPARPAAIEIKIGSVDLVSKLDALGAAIAAVREAHRFEMSAQSWSDLNRAQDAIAAAILNRNSKRLIGT